MKRPRNFLFRCELACIGLGESKLNAFDLLLGKFKLLLLLLGEVQKQFGHAILPLIAERLELCNGFFEEFCHVKILSRPRLKENAQPDGGHAEALARL
jgi:hypothetical protein